MYKNDDSSFDLAKCLYYSLEKISENVPHDQFSVGHSKTSAIYILGVSDGRLDHTFSVLQNVYNYVGSNFSMKTEFYMVSKSSMTVFLKNGSNNITPSQKYENRRNGYSLVPLQDNININLIEYDGELKIGEVNKNTTFGSVIHRNKFKGDLIKINVDYLSNGYLIYCCTSSFHHQ
jgi:thiamine pyrophosphokinase